MSVFQEQKCFQAIKSVFTVSKGKRASFQPADHQHAAVDTRLVALHYYIIQMVN